MAESWSTMGDVDREETKSLDSSNSDGGAPGAAGEERSENHSSMSDMVHLEKEEAELLLEEAEKAAAEVEEEDDEDDELQGSVLSVLGGESELAELREEELDLTRGTGGALLAFTDEEEPHHITMQVVPPMALPLLPIVRLEPPSSTPTPVPALTAAELEQLLSTQALHPPPVLSAEAGSQPLDQPLHPVEEPAAAASQGAAAPAKGEPEKAGVEKAGQEKAGPEKTGPERSGPHHGTGELPMMLCGGAALVAVVGVVAYGVVVYCRK